MEEEGLHNWRKIKMMCHSLSTRSVRILCWSVVTHHFACKAATYFRTESLQTHSPKVLVHGLEEEFVVGLVQDLFKIQQSDILGRNGYLHQVRRLLLVDVIYNFGFCHLDASFFF